MENEGLDKSGTPQTPSTPPSGSSNAALAIKVFLIAAAVFAAIWYINRLNG